MKMLYIASVDFFEKPNPSFHLMKSMLDDLLEAGFEVFFIGIAKKNVEKHIPGDLLSNDLFHYDLITLPYVEKSAFISRYVQGYVYSKKVKRKAAKIIDNVDFIFVQSSPTVFYTIKFLRKLTKKPIVYNVQDMFPGSSIASGVLKNHFLQNYFFNKQKKTYDNSDVIVAISNDMKQKLLEQGVNEKKIHVIVNWFDDKTVHEVSWEENRFVKKFNLSKEKFYVQYAGTMGYVFDYKMVLNVAECLKEEKDIVFQMIGEGSQKNAFVSEANNRGLTNIQFLPLQPQEMVSDVYSACSICLIPLKKGIIGNSVPSKVGLLMQCKRAIVTSADKDSDYNKMINLNGIGFAKASDDVEGVVRAILTLRKNEDLRISMGQKGYKYGHTLYSRSKNMEKYITLFESLINYDKAVM